jgi:hypothetical protein
VTPVFKSVTPVGPKKVIFPLLTEEKSLKMAKVVSRWCHAFEN